MTITVACYIHLGNFSIHLGSDTPWRFCFEHLAERVSRSVLIEAPCLASSHHGNNPSMIVALLAASLMVHLVEEDSKTLRHKGKRILLMGQQRPTRTAENETVESCSGSLDSVPCSVVSNSVTLGL